MTIETPVRPSAGMRVPTALRAFPKSHAMASTTLDGPQDLPRPEVTHALRMLVEHAGIGAALLSPDGRILFANPCLADLMGASQRDLLGSQFAMYFYGRDQAHLKAGIAQAAVDGQCEAVVQLSNATAAHKLKIFCDASQSRPIVGVLVESVEHAEATVSDEASRDRARSALLAKVSHEMRTPLNAVLGLAQLLRVSLRDAGQGRLAMLIENAGQHLLDMVSGLIEHHQLDSDGLPLKCEPVNLKEVASSVCEALQVLAERKALPLTLEVCPSAQRRIDSDPSRLRQALFNLIGNAIKFTKTGHVRVLIDAPELTMSTMLCRIRVIDTGPGIPADVLPKLFQLFQRGKNMPHDIEGAGLGLAITRQIARRMDGDCKVDSHLAVGSTFTFTARLAIADVHVIDSSLAH